MMLAESDAKQHIGYAFQGNPISHKRQLGYTSAV